VTLTTDGVITNKIAYTGIRAHQIAFTNNINQINTFPCWIANIIETPHRLTIYLKLNRPSSHDKDYHVQAEIFKERWHEIEHRTSPLYIRLNPKRLLLME
jgi:molybdate transport system permease protein